MGKEIKLEEQCHYEDVSPPSQYATHTLRMMLTAMTRIELFRAYEPQQLIEKISPTPLLMTIASRDVLTPADLALGAYARAREPKHLQLLPGGHFEAYSGPYFERNAGTQTEFLKKWLVEN